MPDNDQKLPFNVRPDTVGRYALGGALTGAGVAAALNLAHMLKRLSAERSQAKDPTETDEGTIVLTLPKRAESAADIHQLLRNQQERHYPKSVHEEFGVEHEEMPTDGQEDTAMSPEERGAVQKSMAPTGRAVKEEETIRRTMRNTKGQLRHPDGQYGMKTQVKRGNWQTLTASLLAAGGGGYIGYRLVDKIYEIKRIKDKEKQLQSAQQEYLDKLQKNPADVKEAQERHRTFNTLDYPMGLGVLALLLGGGATAFVTKKILDQMTEEQDLPGAKPPQLQKIVFRSGGESQKAASADNDLAHGLFKAALPIYMDICAGEPAVLGDEKVAACLDECEVGAADLYKMATSDYVTLLSTLQANPELRRTIQRAAMEKHPLLRYFQWAVGLPGISDIADRKLYHGVQQHLGPKVAEEKDAALGLLPEVGSIMSSFYGSELAERAGRKKEEKEEATEEKEDPNRADTLLSKLQIVGEGEEADQFIQQNQAAIKQLLERLAKTGKI
jgi:hypothetical protein